MSSFSSAPVAGGVFPGRDACVRTLSFGRWALLWVIAQTVIHAAAPVITAPAVLDIYNDPEARESGAYFSFAIAASGEPTSYDAAGLPSWCTLNPTTGVLFGNSQTPGRALVTLMATNADGTGTAQVELRCHPTVLGVDEDAGTFRAGERIQFRVGFNADMLVTGLPQLTLSVGGQPRVASYVSGSGSSTLHFEYTVAAGDGAGTVMPIGLELNGGSIREASGVDAALTLHMRFFVADAAIDAPSATGRPMPLITVQPESQVIAVGALATLRAGSDGVDARYQWRRNGETLAGAGTSTLTLSNVGPAQTGVYSAVVSEGGTMIGETDLAVVGITSSAKIVGAAAEVGSDIRHPNGNVYDQIVLQGAAAAVRADPGQVTRVSFIDLSDDIVQLEFFGAGTVSLELEGASGPASPLNYNQPGALYMKGHARIVVAGANETTYLSIFSVGRANAVNQALFRDGVEYDGVADVASVAILSSNGRFGGIFAGNASFVAPQGIAGIYAPGIDVALAVTVGDVAATAQALPVLMFGSVADFRLTGGDLEQPNQQAVQVDGIADLKLVPGSTSHGELLPAQTLRGRLVEDGTDVSTRATSTP